MEYLHRDLSHLILICNDMVQVKVPISINVFILMIKIKT